MTPEAALTIVLFTPEKMPVLFRPAESVPLLVTVVEVVDADDRRTTAAVADGRAGQHIEGESCRCRRRPESRPGCCCSGDGLAARRRIGAHAAFAGAADRLRPDEKCRTRRATRSHIAAASALRQR